MMRSKAIILFLVGAALLSVRRAEAQEIFRTRPRPTYAEAPRYNVTSAYNWQRPQVAARYPEAIDRTSDNAPAGFSDNADRDYERLQTAWINYVREARRYQARYQARYEDVAARDGDNSSRSRCDCPRQRDGFEAADYAPELSVPYPTDRTDRLRPGAISPAQFDPYNQASFNNSRPIPTVPRQSLFGFLKPVIQ